MNELKMDLLKNYYEIIEGSYNNSRSINMEINDLMNKIRSHIKELNPIGYNKKMDLIMDISLE